MLHDRRNMKSSIGLRSKEGLPSCRPEHFSIAKRLFGMTHFFFAIRIDDLNRRTSHIGCPMLTIGPEYVLQGLIALGSFNNRKKIRVSRKNSLQKANFAMLPALLYSHQSLFSPSKRDTHFQVQYLSGEPLLYVLWPFNHEHGIWLHLLFF